MTRKELFDAIWSQPLSVTAKQLDMSVPKLKNICTEWNIPLPPNGFGWALNSGMQIEVPECPPYDGEAMTVEEFIRQYETSLKSTLSRPLIAKSCLDGREVYFDSIKSAMVALQSTYGGIYKALKGGYKHKGMFLRYAQPDEKPKGDTMVKQELIDAFNEKLKELSVIFTAIVNGNN